MKSKQKKTWVLIALLLSARVVLAPPYTIDWYTVDGGGAMDITGGIYSLSGTIGQPDAGRMFAGTDTVDGGFWGLIAPVPPHLNIKRSANNIVISWPSPSTGFKLQQNTRLSSGWTDVAQTPGDDGTTRTVVLPFSSLPMFYRLSN